MYFLGHSAVPKKPRRGEGRSNYLVSNPKEPQDHATPASGWRGPNRAPSPARPRRLSLVHGRDTTDHQCDTVIHVGGYQSHLWMLLSPDAKHLIGEALAH